MAESNRVFVSPGVYTSEKDLTFVSQSVGVTTLGLVGETLKGPAFEPVLIKSYDEFKLYFGGTLPDKDGKGIPKYQLPYVAKSYLQESNQLFVTRVLGLSGYKPQKSYLIKALGGVDIVNTGYTTGRTDFTLNQMLGSLTFLSDKNSKEGDSIIEYISGNTYNTGEWFTIGSIPENLLPITGTNVTLTKGPISNVTNYIWSNNYYNSGDTKVYSYVFQKTSTPDTFTVTEISYNSTINKYNNLVIGVLRSRGSYKIDDLILQVSGDTSVSLTNNTYLSGINTINGDQILFSDSSILNNPYNDFTINVTGLTGNKQFVCNLNSTSKNFISKVLGTNVYDKDENDYPLYVHELYPNLIHSLTERGLIRGISTDITTYTHDESNDGDFMTQWDTASSPMVVSEVRGNSVSDLFQVITISDGESSNKQVKISIANINIETGEFDVIIRDFNDTDDNIIALEKFTRCTMNPELPGYIGLKIGTSDGEYELRSKYIMLNLALSHPTDAIPSGFRGFTTKTMNSNVLGNILYKTKYYESGDIDTYDSLGNGIPQNSDKVRKVSLGLSTQIGFDNDMFMFKGKKSQTKTTEGFHLSVNASTITGNTLTGLEFQTTPYDLEGQTGENNKLDNINYRKFTFTVCGGYDGWDIYRKTRTNTDGYIIGKKIYSDAGFNTSNGNSDYYAYEQAINTFSNPESVDINIFATPGLNYQDHLSLITNTIDMIENDRADSLYVLDSPNYTSSDEVIDSIDIANIDSNYSATYWPWIQVRDNDNSTQLYLPPTGEVLRNLALTDNVSYPWFATAGFNRGLVNSIKAQKKLTLEERDKLYLNRINPIATFADTGTIIWGNKTLQVRESALDRINVRRLLLRTRKLISSIAVRLLFEQNDEQVRQQFLRLVNPILESIKKERGLYDFRVTVSNDPEDIDANTLRGKIWIKPTRSLEFIDLEYILTPTGASFENI